MPVEMFNQFFLIVGLLAIGYACRKLGVLDQQSNQHLSNLLLCLTIPATSIYAAIGQPIENLSNVLFMCGIALAIFAAVPILAKPLCRVLGWSDVYRLMLVFGNVGFVGIPVVSAIYGQQNVFYVTLYIMVFNIAFFTWGVATMKKAAGYVRPESAGDMAGKQRSGRWRAAQFLRDLANPGIVSALIAIVIFAFQIPVQQNLADLIGMVSSMNTPLALVVIGSSLAAVPVREIFSDKNLYAFAALKLLVLPALVFLALWFTPLPRTLVGIFVTLACMPVAGNLSMVAIQYRGDIALVSKGTALTTLLFIPAVLLWTGIIAAL